MSDDFLDEMIAKRTARDPTFPQTMAEARSERESSFHEHRLAKLLTVPDFAAEYERQLCYLGQSGRTPSE